MKTQPRDITEELCRITDIDEDTIFTLRPGSLSIQQYEALKTLWNALSLVFSPKDNIDFTVKVVSEK